MMFKIGDQVAAIDEDVKGLIIAIKKDHIEIETSDGFVMAFQQNELILDQTNPDFHSFFSKEKVNSALKEKKDIQKSSSPKLKKSRKDDYLMEVDLHIEKLVPSKKGMNNYDILNLQLETAKRQLEFALKNRIPRVVFIHGVGEGVLKYELDSLFKRFDNISVQEANFQKYGFGATEVYFIQKNLL
jgi:hypothetical protein